MGKYILTGLLFLGTLFYPAYSEARGFGGGARGGDFRGGEHREGGAEHREGEERRGNVDQFHRGGEDQHLREPAEGLREPYRRPDAALYEGGIAAPVYVEPTDDDNDDGSEDSNQNQNQQNQDPFFTQ